MSTNQELRQAAVRAVTSTTGSYNEDWMALFDAASIASGEFNGRFIAWLQQQTGSSSTNINDLKADFATQLGVASWHDVTSLLNLPMGDFVASCVFDLDATFATSYPGTGTSFLNVEPTPADGELQAEYDFGTGVGAPTFTGTAGSPAAYFSFNNDSFAGDNALSTFLDAIHKTTGGADYTMVMTVYYKSANTVFATNRQAGTTNKGVMMYTLAADDKLKMLQRGDSGNSTTIETNGTLNADEWNFLAVSHKHSTNESTVWLNSSLGLTATDTFNTTTSTASANEFYIGAYGGGTLPLANDSRVRSFDMFNGNLTDAQMAIVATQLGTRHNDTYVATVPDIPTDDLSLWMRGNESDEVGRDVSENITSWNGISANTHVGAQGTASSQPVYTTGVQNGLSAINFGANDFLEVPHDSSLNLSTGDFTVYIAHRPTTVDSEFRFMYEKGNGGNTDIDLLFGINNNAKFRVITGDNIINDFQSTSSVVADTNYIHRIEQDLSGAGTLEIFMNGVSDGSTAVLAGSDSLSSLKINARNSGVGGYLGYMFEILVYQGLHSGAESTEVEDYLTEKWGF